MARRSATSAFLLLLSLLAVAHCRALEADTTSNEPAAALGDDTGPPNPTLPAEVVPAEQHGFLRLPSHRRHSHQPCRHGLFHRHIWWARHHGLFRDLHRRGGEGAEAHTVGLPSEHVHDGEPEEAELEAIPVADPDPDRSLADSSDGEVELVSKTSHDGDDEAAAVKSWKKEMLWRMFRHGLRHHRHHHHHHHHHHHEEEEDHEQEEEGAAGVKRLHHHHDDDEDDMEEEKKMRKLFHFHHHHDKDEEKTRKPYAHDGESDDEDDEVEEMVRRFRKAIMRRRSFRHGRRFHHHHQHAEEADREQADGEQQQEEGGVVTWIKGLMNRV